ncbi:MAG: M17 family peptidase N-terminal domain-containing protein, partial [bacterium]
MEIEIAHAPHPGQPHRLCPVHGGQREPFAAAGPEVSRVAGALAETREFTGEASQTLLLPTLEGQWLWVGLGDPEALTRPRFCEAVAKGFNELRQAGAAGISLLLPDLLPWAADEAARFAVEALWMAGYTFDRHRTRAKPHP